MIEGRIYRDRTEAGLELASRLSAQGHHASIVFGLVRGGLLVAEPIARELGARLEPMIVRKVGHPRQPELGVGAIAPDGQFWIVEDLGVRFQLDQEDLEPVIQRERAELLRREAEFTGGHPISFAGENVIVADDGLATGASAMVAGLYLRRHGAARAVLAVPVCPPEAAVRMQSFYDEVFCLQQIPEFRSVGQWYEDFRQLGDDDVKEVLSRWAGVSEG